MTATLIAPPETVKLHHPSCPNVDSGVPAVAEWTTAELDDLLASSAMYEACGFCRKFFPATAPDYSPPASVLTSDDVEPEGPPDVVEEVGGDAD